MGGFSTLGGGGITKLSELIIDVNKDWGKHNITNFGAGGIDLYSMVTAHRSRHEVGGADPIRLRYVISNNPIVYHDSEVVVTCSTYCKVKTILLNELNPTPTTMRTYFELRSYSSSYTARARIYKNGSAYGTERSTTSTTYVSFTEDLSFAKGDSVELWALPGATYAPAYVRNFRILGDLAPINPLSVTLS